MNQTLRLLADRHIPLPETVLPDGLILERFDPSDGMPDGLDGFDALLIRTVTRVDRITLPERPGRLQWIGSATAGFDHVDREWLASLDIRFDWAPGCNARSVAEYVATSLLIWSAKSGRNLNGLRAGIVGAGHAGEATGELLRRLGLQVFFYDPPRLERDPRFRNTPMEQILDCDLLSFHTSLVDHGAWPSRHWLDSRHLENHRFELILNTSRGGVIRDPDLLEALRSGRTGSAILDVWEGEPLFDRELAGRALFATPHIAGYSLDAKSRASNLAIGALCSHFGLPRPVNGWSGIQAGSTRPPELPVSPGDSLEEILTRIHPLGEYDRLFRLMAPLDDKARSRRFQEIRTEHPLRREYSALELPERVLNAHPELEQLGIRRVLSRP